MTQTATTITVDSLPIANSIDPVQDRLLIYTATATDIQGISRNVLLGLGSQPLGLTDSQSPQNKTFDNTNALTVKATNLVIQDGSDTTKQVKFIASGITTGNTRSYTLPDYNATLATLAGTETLTNKTITAPVTTAITNTGGLTTNAATVTGAATIGTTLGVTGNTTLGGTLSVAGALTLTASNSISAANLATNAIQLAYTQINTGFGPTASTSAVQITGLTATATVPSGGRAVKITVNIGGVTTNTAIALATISLWSGSVGSGTILTVFQNGIVSAASYQSCSFTFVHTPASGSITYNVGVQTSNGSFTAQLDTHIASILVEAN